MFKIKILGAGSIGNHLAHAARTLGWQVAVCDRDPAALERMRTEIYPGRYGAWDEAIELYEVGDAPRAVYDLILIGTPPDVHIPLALEAVGECPRAILVEKPLCPPNLAGAEDLRRLAGEQNVTVFVGYDHVVGRGATEFCARSAQIGPVQTLDVEFREHWGGIFAAHPWLAGPQDSYLGHWQRGGGASGEHSHALNLWQHVAHGIGAGRVREVTASLDYVREADVDYDSLCLLHLRTEGGLLGRVVQDVITSPPRKWARIQGRDGSVALEIDGSTDRVTWRSGDTQPQTSVIEKTRPDDFIQELKHVERVLDEGDRESGILLERGLETMLVIAAAHRSARDGRTIAIDHDAGCTPEALRAI